MSYYVPLRNAIHLKKEKNKFIAVTQDKKVICANKDYTAFCEKIKKYLFHNFNDSIVSSDGKFEITALLYYQNSRKYLKQPEKKCNCTIQ
jgi:hypothetical protein